MVKTLLLTQGKSTIIDDEDYPLVAYRNLYYNGGYAKFSVSKHEKVYVHRLILGLREGEECDHINGDKLCNLRCNLRVVTRSQNNMNSLKRKHSTSQYKGVIWNREHSRWQSSIMLNHHSFHLGYFTEEVDAAERYNEEATRLFGVYARLNDLKDLRENRRVLLPRNTYDTIALNPKRVIVGSSE